MWKLVLLMAAVLFPNGCKDPRTTTSVIDSARAGDTQKLDELLAAGADPNQRAGVNNWTPLMHAIHKGQAG